MGSTKISQPETPQAPSTAEAVKAWVESMPQVYETQMKYDPLLAAQQVQMAQQYAEPLGQALLASQKAMYPEEYAMREELMNQAQEGMQSDVPDWMKEEYLSNLNSNLGTNVGSMVGADYVSRSLMQQKQDWQNQYRNMALALSGSQPTFNAQSPSSLNYMQGFTPGQNMNYMASNYGNYSNAYSSMYNTNAQYLPKSGLENFSNQVGYLQSGLGSIGQIGSGAMMMSSRTLKENISDINIPLEKINKLRGVMFDWKSGERDGGVIAEEVKEIIPDAVGEINGIMAIKPMVLIAYLIEAVKDISSKIKLEQDNENE